MKYDYMVVYQHNTGTGRIQVIRDRAIESYDDVEGIDEKIKKHNGLNCTVTDFKLLRTYEEEK